MENLKEYKNKLIGIRNLILKSLANAESKEEIHRFAISLHNVNEKIKMVEEKLAKNPMKEVKTKPLPTKYIFNPDDVKTADPLIRWINTLKDEIENKKSR